MGVAAVFEREARRPRPRVPVGPLAVAADCRELEIGVVHAGVELLPIEVRDLRFRLWRDQIELAVRRGEGEPEPEPGLEEPALDESEAVAPNEEET